MTAEGRTTVAVDKELSFSYEVNWKKSAITFHGRFDKYLDSSFFQHRVSKKISPQCFVMCVLCVFVASPAPCLN